MCVGPVTGLLSVCPNPKSVALNSPIERLRVKFTRTFLFSAAVGNLWNNSSKPQKMPIVTVLLSRVQLNADGPSLSPDSLASHASTLDTSPEIPRLPKVPELASDPLLSNHKAPVSCCQVCQASFPFIRWCSATMQQSGKIHSLQEVGGI